MRTIYFTAAIREAFDAAMAEDPRVVVLGEDVDRSTIGSTKGLIETYGPSRVRNTPISEATFVGSCVGAAAAGLRPVVDLMFSSFCYIAMDQLGNQAARLRYMSGGQLELPIVYLAGTGPSGSAAAQHSENPHAILMHLSGLKVVFPSTPFDAKGLLLAAIRDPDPVVFLLDLMLAGQKGEVPAEPFEVPLGKAAVRRVGDDVTIVAIGSLVGESLIAADELERDGISATVIDLRSLVPLDLEAVLASVRRTGRLVVADPARRMCGAAGHIVSAVATTAWDALKAPPQLVTWPDVPMPFSPVLERAVTVRAENISAAARATVGRI